MRLNKKSLLLGMIVLLLSCIVGSSAKNSSFLENVQASMVQEKDSDQSQDQPEIGVSALGYCVMNADTGEIVLQKNADEKLHPASITKIMTLLVTVEQCKNLDSVTTVHRLVQHFIRCQSRESNLQSGIFYMVLRCAQAMSALIS